jgi:ribosomal protein L14
MVKKEQKLRIGDNSDAKVALCIHTNNKKNFIKKSSLGNFIKVTLKRRVSRRKTIKNKVNWALVCSTKQKLQRLSGESLQFKAAKITIVDEKKKKSMGTRIKGAVPREICKKALFPITIRADRAV